MAQNDMEVIIYKILRYLYDAMKAGKQPMAEELNDKAEMEYRST